MKKTLASLAGVLMLALPGAASAALQAQDTLVTSGSRPSPFSQNKQNEPAVAIDASDNRRVAAGANDNIDLEDCNAGDDDDCPFTPGVGVSGVSLSSDGGNRYQQPTYTGYSARVAPSCRGVIGPDAGCTPASGPIGTLPRYFEAGLASGGDPALAWGPQRGADGTFSYGNGSRLYYANLASNFPGKQAFKGAEAIYVSRLDSQDYGRAKSGDNSAWKAPVLVSKQSSATFSDKEQIFADNASSSRYFGYVYICNVAFRGNGNGGGGEPLLVARSTDAGASWTQSSVTAATNSSQTGGRQGCAVRTDSTGVVYVYYVGTDIKTRGAVFFQLRSFNGGKNFERPRIVARVDEVGLPDPATGRESFDGVAGARTSTFPTVDIANGAPTGAGATNTILLAGPDAQPVTPSDTSPRPNERVLVRFSSDGGESFQDGPDGSPASDRPNFPAVALSPDGTEAWLTYDNFRQPFQSTTAAPRLQQGVVRHADVGASGRPGAWSDVHRAADGDARGSSQNNLVAEFLGDYNYASASNTGVAAVWNDVRAAADCPAIDAYRQQFVNAVRAGTAQPADEEREENEGTAPAEQAGAPEPPAPQQDCPPTFGNSDIWGGFYTNP
jgi:hypothetical protein